MSPLADRLNCSASGPSSEKNEVPESASGISLLVSGRCRLGRLQSITAEGTSLSITVGAGARYLISNGAPISSFQVFCCSSFSLAAPFKGLLAQLAAFLHCAFAVVSRDWKISRICVIDSWSIVWISRLLGVGEVQLLGDLGVAEGPAPRAGTRSA